MRKTVKQNRSQSNYQPKRATTTRRSPRPLGSKQGVADSVRTTLSYSDVISLTPSSTVGQYTFRGNSCFDPDYTSGGHQPQYYDQMSLLYTRYRVYGSRIAVSGINEQVGAALQITVIPSSDITAFTTSTYPLEHPYATPMRLLGVGGLMSGSVSTAMATAHILGLRPREILDQDYSATIGSNPSSIWYWQIVCQNLSAENVLASFRVTIKYDVEFYDRNLTAPSTTLTDPESIPREKRLALAYGDKYSGVEERTILNRKSVDRPVVAAHASRAPDSRSLSAQHAISERAGPERLERVFRLP